MKYSEVLKKKYPTYGKPLQDDIIVDGIFFSFRRYGRNTFDLYYKLTDRPDMAFVIIDANITLKEMIRLIEHHRKNKNIL